jgi:hypothetical protein
MKKALPILTFALISVAFLLGYNTQVNAHVETCKDCPTVTWSASRSFCPSGYSEVHSGSHSGECTKEVNDYATRYADKIGNPAR